MGATRKVHHPGVKPTEKVEVPPHTLKLNDWAQEFYYAHAENPLAPFMNKDDWFAFEIKCRMISLKLDHWERYSDIRASDLEMIVRVIESSGSSVPARMRFEIPKPDSETDDGKKAEKAAKQKKMQGYYKDAPAGDVDDNVTSIDEYIAKSS